MSAAPALADNPAQLFPLSSFPFPDNPQVKSLLDPPSRRELLQRPKVRRFPRLRLELDFAILLMRCSYAVADDLDFMPMNDFQRNFFLLRQREWESYRLELPVTQGDLADPAYFDFVSFCQYATIAEGMRNGRTVFEELVDAEGATAIVTRDMRTSPASNAELPAVHAERVGERILAWIDERFPTIAPKVPPPSAGAPSAAALLEEVRQLAAIFEIQNFMLQSTVSPLADGGGITWTLAAPATLWSSQVLRVRGDQPVNDFEVKAVLAYLRRCGVPASASTSIERSTFVVHTFRWPRGAVKS